MAAVIACKRNKQVPSALGINHDIPGIVPHGNHRCPTFQHGFISIGLRRHKTSLHTANVGHCPAYILCRKFKCKRIIRLQKHIDSLPETLPYGSVGSLPEISSLGVLLTRPSRN